jgi:phospholipase C
MPPTAPTAPEDPIQHVIVLMLENRSFDHMLGGLAAAIGDLDGVPAAGQPPRTNKADGKTYKQTDGASRTLKFDPMHELENTLVQLAKGTNSGFVADFAQTYPLSKPNDRSQPDDRAEIMKYFADGQLPALHALAKNFAVCDRWFSSLPGPTWPNRFFVHSGTSLGRVLMPQGILDANLHWYDQTTIYDRLNEKKIDWRIYYGDIPQSLILVHQLEPHNAARYSKLQQFFQDAGGDAKDFPQYAFIEPPFYDPGAADDHPPHDVFQGERLIADVYNAILRNDELWKSSLLVVLFDEHGGFYDHVVPPATVAPDHHTEEYTFDQLGVRVPAILVSPFVKPGVIHTQFDHTSLLKYLIDKWDLGPLGARADQANTFAGNLLNAPENPDRQLAIVPTPPPSDLPPPPPKYGQIVGRVQPTLNAHQSALVAMTQLLESMTQVEGQSLLGRVKRLVTGFDGVVDVAMERVEDFLGEKRDDHTDALTAQAARRAASAAVTTTTPPSSSAPPA